ncbi:MAG: sugar phosphate isomerase/epimerase [Clostridia bacterium]|nr:sugar phosphate isomerase/epimerase [Clostridia bacterium]
MSKFQIGAMVESFRTDLKSAIDKSAILGINGLQMHATKGEKLPENMTKEKRRELLDYVKSKGMCFSAICGDFGKGFANPELNDELIEKSKRVMEMAKDLETNIVTTHIGVVPRDKNHEKYKILQEACYELSRFADSIGSHFAIETGTEDSETLKEFLDNLGSKGVSVNLDPANLVMVRGVDPVKAVYDLKDYIVHTHAKDGIMLVSRNLEDEYKPGFVREPDSKFFKEVPLGTGKVDFPAYLRALEDIGYKGFLTIEREVGENPSADIELAARFLRTKMEEM